MNRRLATALAFAAFLTFVSAPAATTSAQSAQEEGQPTQRSGQKEKKEVQTACPVHPEIKARTAEKCPKCRAELRKQKGARERDKNRVQPQQGAPANE